MRNREYAAILINAIKELANKPDNLDNLEWYLSNHFDVWIETFANTPESLVYELKNFAEMKI